MLDRCARKIQVRLIYEAGNIVHVSKKRRKFTQCWCNVGPLSAMLALHSSSTGLASCTSWVSIRLIVGVGVLTLMVLKTLNLTKSLTL